MQGMFSNHQCEDTCYYIENYKKRLADTFCIDENVHPTQFCPKCFAATWHNLRRGSTPTFSTVTWLQHTNTCSICSKMEKNVKEDAPKEEKCWSTCVRNSQVIIHL